MALQLELDRVDLWDAELAAWRVVRTEPSEVELTDFV